MASKEERSSTNVSSIATRPKTARLDAYASKPAWKRFLVAVLLFAASALLRILLFAPLGTRTTYTTFYPAVMLAALYGGVYYGLLVAALSAATVIFWREPLGAPIIVSPSDWVGMAVFLTSCTMISIITEHLNRAKTRALAAAEDASRELQWRRRTEKALHESAELSRRIIESSLDFITVLDLEGRVLQLSPTGQRLLEIEDASPLIGQFWVKFWQDEHLPVVNQAVEDARTGGVGRFQEFTLTQGGRPKWWDVLVTPILDAEGRVERLLAIARDVTERKAAEEALRQSEERLGLTLEYGRMGMWEWDVRRDRSVWNALEYELLGYPPGDGSVATDLFFSRVHPDDIAELKRVLARAIEEEGFELDHECRIIRADNGQERWIASRGRLIRDAAGRPERMMGLNYDITEKKRAEAALQQANAILTEADRRKDEFLAMLAHELRNPLAPIRNAVQVLRIIGEENPRAQRQKDVIERQVAHMARLIDDLLDVSRVTQGKIELRRQSVALGEVLSRAVEANAPLIQARRHTLHYSMPPAGLSVEGDFDRLIQAVGNLLNNAVKYTDEGGQIWLRAERENGQAVVRVRDTGVGMTLQLLPHVFDLFVQADRSLAREQGGLGIGLTMVRNLVEMHGGSVEARSEGVGKGSEFVVRLPALAEAAADKAPLELPEAAPPPCATRPCRVLVVDDVADSADSLAELLGMWSHEAHVAHNGSSALRAAQDIQPEVVLLDLGMPGMDGYEVARRLRAEHGDKVFLVALTGYGQPQDRGATRAAGFDAHLVKPVDLNELQKILTRHGPEIQ